MVQCSFIVIVSMSYEAILGMGHTNYLLLLQKPYCNQCLKMAGFACSIHYCRVSAQSHSSLVGVSWIYLLWFLQTAWETFIHVSGSQVDFSNEHLGFFFFPHELHRKSPQILKMLTVTLKESQNENAVFASHAPLFLHWWEQLIGQIQS